MTRAALAAQRVVFQHVAACDSASYNITGEALTLGERMARDAVEVGGALLVQCWGGVNRAPAIAVALLMRMEAVDVVAACVRVSAARGEILTNRTFRRQLLQEAVRAHVLPQHPFHVGSCDHARGPYRWDAQSPEELLCLLWFAASQGTGMDCPDVTGASFSDHLMDRSSRRQWSEHSGLMRRLILIQGMLGTTWPPTM